jgi:hypothetical protein
MKSQSQMCYKTKVWILLDNFTRRRKKKEKEKKWGLASPCLWYSFRSELGFQATEQSELASLTGSKF